MEQLGDKEFLYWFIDFVQSEEGGGWQEYTKWLETNYLEKERRGASRSIILKIRTDCVKNEHHTLSFTEEKNIGKYRNIAPKYFKYKSEENSKLRKFRFYFFHEEDKDEIPQLARLNLEIINKKKVKISHFLNNRDFTGTCYTEVDSIVINARTSSRDRPISIHIKLNSSDFDQKVFLCGYSTYLKSEIKCGSSVLVSSRTDFPPQGKSQFYNLKASEDLSEQKVIELISEERVVRSYLSRRNSNFIKIPTAINSLLELESRSRKIFEQEFNNPERKFISREVPKIMFAAPSKSIEYNEESLPFIQMIASKILDEYSCTIDIPLTETMNRGTSELKPRETFIKMKTTDLFVLIYNKTRVGSFSLVELGYAIHACKKCIVFYDKKSLSSQMQALSNQGLVRMFELPKKRRDEFIVRNILTAL